MKILAITNQFPLPQDRGGPLRILGLMRALAAAHDLQVLAVRRPDTSDQLAAELSTSLGAPIDSFVPRRSGARGLWPKVGRWTRALQRGMPPWVLEQFHPQLCRRAVMLAQDVSVVVLLDDYAGAYAPHLSPLAPLVADKHQVAGWSRCERGSVHDQMSRDAPTFVRHALGRHLTRRFERLVASAATAVVVTSNEEARRFEDLYGRRPDTVRSAIEAPAEARLASGTGQIGWLGTHAYEPNVSGLVRFVEHGWDAIGADGFRLLVAGGEPTSAVWDLERHPGVRILGYVEDLSPFTARLDAGVVPLWSGGAGIKMKTLLLMGAGVPIACTPVAVEGLGAEHGRHCLIADDPVELAAAVRSILDDARLASRLAREGRRLVLDGYTWETAGPRFVDVVERAAGLPSG